MVARLPLEPTATIACAAQVTLVKRTTKRPAELAVVDLRLGPLDTVTRSFALKPRPLTVSGCRSVIVSAGRAALAAGSPFACAAPLSVTMVTTTSTRIDHTTQRV